MVVCTQSGTIIFPQRQIVDTLDSWAGQWKPCSDFLFDEHSGHIGPECSPIALPQNVKLARMVENLSVVDAAYSMPRDAPWWQNVCFDYTFITIAAIYNHKLCQMNSATRERYA